ncbi:MAG: hypothetical protein V4714_13625 [Bacteroidota bacterium]
MIIIAPFLWVHGMALYPFILIKYRADLDNLVLINHERIHHRQQVELLILPFYLWYFLEYFINRLRYKNHSQAYRNISFEREAYQQETNMQYLAKRKTWAFLRFY